MDCLVATYRPTILPSKNVALAIVVDFVNTTVVVA